MDVITNGTLRYISMFTIPTETKLDARLKVQGLFMIISMQFQFNKFKVHTVSLIHCSNLLVCNKVKVKEWMKQNKWHFTEETNSIITKCINKMIPKQFWFKFEVRCDQLGEINWFHLVKKKYERGICEPVLKIHLETKLVEDARTFCDYFKVISILINSKLKKNH